MRVFLFMLFVFLACLCSMSESADNAIFQASRCMMGHDIYLKASTVTTNESRGTDNLDTGVVAIECRAPHRLQGLLGSTTCCLVCR